MNQARLAERVVAILEDRAARDSLEWTAALTLAGELFGDEPTPAQLDRLRRVLFRSAVADPPVIEVAQFRPRPDHRLRSPIAHPATYSIASGDSGGLVSTAVEYGVRLLPVD